MSENAPAALEAITQTAAHLPALAGALPYLAVALSAFGLILLVTAGRQKRAPLRQAKAKPFELEYLRREPMTPTEMKFFKRLVAALPEAVIAPQVAMSALIDLPAHQNQGKFAHVNRSKFSQQRLDFVVFDGSSGKAIFAIELDDHTHDSDAQKAKDAERDNLLESVGYPVERFDARQMPTAAALRKCLY